MVVFGNISLPVARIVCLTPRKHEIRSESRGMPVGTSGWDPLAGSRVAAPTKIFEVLW